MPAWEPLAGDDLIQCSAIYHFINLPAWPASAARKALFTLPAAFSPLIQWRDGARSIMRTLALLDELEAALASGTNTRRIEMLRRITDLFVDGASRYSEGQIGLFDDVMARLITAIEAKARAKLAHRLAPIANAPANVIYMLAFDDDIEVAQPGAQPIGTARRARTLGQRRQQEPAAPVRHCAAKIAERSGDRRAGRTRRPRHRPFGGQEQRSPFLRCRLPHAGQALDRR